MSRRASAEDISPDRAVAVTAIEHGNIVITVTSQLREARLSRSAAAEGPFVTTIFGGPLCGETLASTTWRMMLRNHAGAVRRVAEFIAAAAK